LGSTLAFWIGTRVKEATHFRPTRHVARRRASVGPN